MKISMIAAIGINRELGQRNELIWRISDDLKRFKELTLGHPVVMGRKTFESIGRILPNRTNIIVSRDSYKKIEAAQVATSLEEAVEIAKNSEGSEEIFILGGAQIFEQMIGEANKLYLTKINAEAPMADAFFPDYSNFKNVVFSEKHNDDGLEYEFVDLTR